MKFRPARRGRRSETRPRSVGAAPADHRYWARETSREAVREDDERRRRLESGPCHDQREGCGRSHPRPSSRRPLVPPPPVPHEARLTGSPACPFAVSLTPPRPIPRRTRGLQTVGIPICPHNPCFGGPSPFSVVPAPPYSSSPLHPLIKHPSNVASFILSQTPTRVPTLDPSGTSLDLPTSIRSLRETRFGDSRRVPTTVPPPPSTTKSDSKSSAPYGVFGVYGSIPPLSPSNLDTPNVACNESSMLEMSLKDPFF